MEYKIIGLMSGTSLDGLDIVLAHFCKKGDDWKYDIIHAQSVGYSKEWQTKLRDAYYQTAEGITSLDAQYGRYLGKKVKEFVEKYKIPHVDFVASHGHTVFHRPDLGYNLQIGCGAHLHAQCGLKVICDFRTLDVAFGGQGAPLVPIGDKLLFHQYHYCLNIGGFANVSFDNDAGVRIAYDICPANYCLNRIMQKRGHDYDHNGDTARSGKINNKLLLALNELEYYHRPAPKSLAQEWVDENVFPIIEKHGDTSENNLATLTEHAAYQIANAIKKEAQVLVTGGGAYNIYLIERIKTYKDIEIVKPSPAIIEFKEALIFAFLGLRRAELSHNCLQSVTGASHNVSSGQMYGFS